MQEGGEVVDKRNTKIAILTTARSDFGPLKRVIHHASTRFEVDLLVAGSHFLASRGYTYSEIEREFKHHDAVTIVPFDAMDDGASPESQVATIANTQLLASRWFANNRCDMLLFAGDRWELWGVTLTAFLHGVPLAHIGGGEVTEGVIDDCVRHAHTKISGLHFAAAEQYARNMSQMGEEDWRISIVGECGLDLIYDSEMATHEEIKAEFGIDLNRETFLVTFHPSTLDFKTPIKNQIGSLLGALEEFTDQQIVFTAPGVEQGSDEVLSAIRDFVSRHPNAFLVNHFGSRGYLSVMKAARLVLGNSSSGLTEAASFGVPAINIGNRQKNRLSADSVQHVDYEIEPIKAAILRAITKDYQLFAKNFKNPYDPFQDGKNSIRIVEILDYALRNLDRDRICVKKFDTQVVSSDWNSLLSTRDLK